MGKPKIPAEQKAAMAAQAEQMKMLKELPLPELQELVLKNPELVGLLEAEELGPSALEDVQTDPRLAETQMQALQSIKERAEQGLTSEDKLAMEQMLGQADAAAKSRQQGLMQEMARRGTLDSGASLAASLAGQQSTASNARQQAMQMAAQSSANRLQAAQQMGSMAGQMEQVDYGRQANLASAKDRIAQANAATRMQTSQQNLAARQAIENQKAALGNQQTMYNISRDQQQFNNQLAKLSGSQSATNAYAQMASQVPQGGGLGQAIGTIGGAAIGSMFGPAGSAAGMQIGAAAGGAFGSAVSRGRQDGGLIHAANGAGGYDTMPFAEAHTKARQLHGGGGGTFKWKGNLYNTNAQGENNPVDMSVIDESGGIQDSKPQPTPDMDLSKIFDMNKMKNDAFKSSEIKDGIAIGKPTGGVKTESYGTDKTATELTQPQGTEEVKEEVKSEGMSDKELSAIKDIAKSIGSQQQAEKPELNLNTNVQFAQPENILAKSMQPAQQFANPFAAQDGGTYYNAEDGDLMYKSDNDGDVVQGDSFAGDRVDAKLNSGEMVLNVSQQQRLMDLLRGKADIEDLGDKDIVEGVPRDYQEKLKAKAKYEDGGKVLSPEELAMYQQIEEEMDDEAMSNQEVESPNLQTKEESYPAFEGYQKLQDFQNSDEGIRRQQYFDDQRLENMESTATKIEPKMEAKEEAPKKFDRNSEYERLVKEYERISNEKPKSDSMKKWATFADIMDRAAANYNPYYKPLNMNLADSIEKSEQSAKKQKLSQLTTMADLLNKMQGIEPKSLSELDKAKILSEKAKAAKYIADAKKAEKSQVQESKSVYEKEEDKRNVEKYFTAKKVAENSAANDMKVDDTLESFLNYSKDSVGGTGPLATGFGLKSYFSQDLENLDAKFKDLGLDKMVKTFAGMSKTVDSDAERRAFEKTVPSITNDDETNLQILLGAKSINLRNQVEAEAQRQYVEKNGKLDSGYKSPLETNPVTTIVNPRTGEMILVPRKEKSSYQKQGYVDLDKYSKFLLRGKAQKPVANSTIYPEFTEKNGKRYKWNPSVKKYQLY